MLRAGQYLIDSDGCLLTSGKEAAIWPILPLVGPVGEAASQDTLSGDRAGLLSFHLVCMTSWALELMMSSFVLET